MSIIDVLNGHLSWHLEEGEALAALRSMPSAALDALITDPPYSSGGMFRGDRAAAPSKKYVQTGTKLVRPCFGGDTRDQRGYLLWCALWLGECQRVLKSGGPVAVFTDWRQLPLMTDALQVAGLTVRGIVPWDKTESVRPVLGRFRAQAEFLVWGSAGPMPLRREVGVLPGAYRERVNPREKKHICGKPVALMRQLVRICKPGGVILDPFAGSGSTGLGCLLEGRRFVGIEMSTEYVDIARARLEAQEAAT